MSEELTEKIHHLLKEAIPDSFQSETLQKELKLSEVEMEKLYREGYTAYHENRTQDAHKIFMLLALLNPFIQKYWLALGASDMTLNQWEDALKRLALATLLEPEDPYPHFHAYYCYKALRNREDATLALEKAKVTSSKEHKFTSLKNEIEMEAKDPWLCM